MRTLGPEGKSGVTPVGDRHYKRRHAGSASAMASMTVVRTVGCCGLPPKIVGILLSAHGGRSKARGCLGACNSQIGWRRKMTATEEIIKVAEEAQESALPMPERSDEPADERPSVEAYDPHFGKQLMKEDRFWCL
jgi:hypothetical protein